MQPDVNGGGAGAVAHAAVEIDSVSKVFGAGAGAVHALDAVSVSIGRNEFFTLLGPSGCGKTTLLRLIAGFDLPTDGRILLDGQEIGHLPPYRRPVNTVFQNYALFPHMSVSENIAFGLEMLGQSREQVATVVDRTLALVRMSELAGRRTNQLSGGQQQRVALARALAPHPKVLLLDEPLSALDLKLRKEMQIELKRLQNETGITFLFVTHDQQEALTMSDRIAVMDDGHILQIGTPQEVYDHPARRFVADFIGDINILRAEIVSRHGARADVRLASGEVRRARVPQALVGGGAVHVAVRPEHATLTTQMNGAALTGILSNIVYFGTGTRYHVTLDDGGDFVVRVQSRHDAPVTHAMGDRLGIVIADDSVQVLCD